MKIQYSLEPFIYQKNMVESTWHKKSLMLDADPGTGKTKMLLDTAGELYLNDKIDAVIVMGPKTVVLNWVNVEIKEHMGANVPYVVGFWATPKKKNLEKLYLLSKTKESFLKVFVINYEAFVSARAVSFIDDVLSKNRCLMVFDESHKLKNWKAPTYKKISALSKKAHYSRAATGTLLVENAADIWSQYELLDPRVLGSNYYGYQNKYVTVKSLPFTVKNKRGVAFNPTVPAGFKNLPMLKKVIAPCTYSIRKDDVLSIPAKDFVKTIIPISEEEIISYKQLYREFSLKIKEEEHYVKNILGAMLKARQLLTGSLEGMDPKKSSKIKKLLSTIDTKEPTIIWCCFKKEVAILRQFFPDAAIVYGDVEKEKRSIEIERFQNGETNVFIGTPQTAGTGITLTKASKMIWLSLPVSGTQYIQSINRAHRIGQNKNLNIEFIIAKKTVDEALYNACMHKQDFKKKTLGDIIGGIVND